MGRNFRNMPNRNVIFESIEESSNSVDSLNLEEDEDGEEIKNDGRHQKHLTPPDRFYNSDEEIKAPKIRKVYHP